MEKRIREPQIWVFDLDDTLLGRENPTRAIAAASRLFREIIGEGSSPYAFIPDTPINHERIERRFTGLTDVIGYLMHSRRKVFPSVRGFLEDLKMQGDLVFVATGRPNRWAHMTEQTMRREGLMHLISDVFYTPDGIRTADSKIDVLRNLSRQYPDLKIRFVDDDPDTVRKVAYNLSGVDVYYRRHRFTSMLVPDQGFTEPNIRSSVARRR